MSENVYGVSGWDDCDEMARRTGGGDIRRLEGDGDYCVGVVLGVPFGRELHWDGSRFNACEGEGCFGCEEGQRLSKKFWVNWFTIGVGSGDNPPSSAPNKLEILEVSSKGFKSLMGCKRKYGLEKQAFECKRSGKGLETEYTFLPDKLIADFDDEVAASLKEAAGDLVDLGALAKRFAEGGSDDDDGGGEAKPKTRAKQSGGKIDSETAGDIAARLRVIDRAVAKELLRQHGCQSVGQIPADKVAVFLQDLAGAEGDSDADPFDF